MKEGNSDASGGIEQKRRLGSLSLLVGEPDAAERVPGQNGAGDRRQRQCGAGPLHEASEGIQGVPPDRQGRPRVCGGHQGGRGDRGEYGEGALRIRGKTVAYYSIGSASIGLQLGVQQKDIILVFLQDKALKDFRAREGWQVGVDGSVVIVDLGAQASIDSTKLNQPIVGFVSSQKGLMYNLTLEGSKITKLPK